MSNEQKPKSQLLTVALPILVVLLASILVLKFVPLKPDKSSYSQVYTLGAQDSETKWFTVPKGYSVSGTYSVSSSNPVEVTMFYGLNILGMPQNVVISEEKVSGSFYFEAEGYAPGDKYYFKLKNPASMGFFGTGPTITVTIRFTVSGWTTWL